MVNALFGDRRAARNWCACCLWEPRARTLVINLAFLLWQSITHLVYFTCFEQLTLFFFSFRAIPGGCKCTKCICVVKYSQILFHVILDPHRPLLSIDVATVICCLWRPFCLQLRRQACLFGLRSQNSFAIRAHGDKFLVFEVTFSLC